jgi:hypothetical protein
MATGTITVNLDGEVCALSLRGPYHGDASLHRDTRAAIERAPEKHSDGGRVYRTVTFTTKEARDALDYYEKNEELLRGSGDPRHVDPSWSFVHRALTDIRRALELAAN